MSQTERREQLIAAAEEVFLRRGYHATTMDDIAQRAGMSKKTVYQIFSAKSELFDALLAEWLAPVTFPVEPDGRSARDVLTDILRRLVDFALAERQVCMIRLLIAEAANSEDIAAALQRQGVGSGRGALEQWLTAESLRGTFKVDDPGAATNLLFFTAAGDFQMGLLLRTRSPPSAEEVAARVERAVAIFFREAT